MRNHHLSRLSIIIGLTLGSQITLASGYHFGTQSVSSQATANSSSAEAADASTLFYNAAGLTKLKGTHISANLNLVMPSIKYSNAQAYYPSGNPQSVSGQTSGKITKDVVAAPHGYISHQMNDKVTLGFGVYVPFGSESGYDDHSVLRYNINQTNLMSVDLNPTIAIQATPKHAFAVGLIAQYTKAELRQYANFGGLLGANGKADGYADFKGHDWGMGYNLAWLWDANDQIRVGANYRSKIKHTLEGSAKWTTPNPLIEKFGYASYEGAKAEIETPESLSIHGMYKATDKWNVFGDVTWTKHSRFNVVNIDYKNKKMVAGGQISDVSTFNPNWKNSFKYSLGASYQVTKPLQLRFGVAYDQTPVRDADTRLSTLPDNDRIWFSLGGKYSLNDHSSINVAYSYIHIKSAHANVNGYCGGGSPGEVACVSSQTQGSADYKNNAQIFGVQYNYNF
ncbi:OmpP1/FadL family transporter [Neisseria sp. Ec49-e6-T10]|uniref:OmpP1/FadL family transporter n=1 Tax=Neisseria sp. Ec49-e6-T10 TaxID=3140744 RepID=UPI003EBE06E3